MTGPSGTIGAVVLDFDGVILESVDIKTDVFRELFSGYPDKVDAILEYHLTHNGISRIIKLRHIFETFLGIPYTPELEQKTVARFSQLAFERVVQCPFVPGALEFLQRFANVWPLYVASASPHEELVRVIPARKLDGFFAGVFGHPTPKSSVIAQAIAAHKVAPVQLLYIGDSQQDLKVAREAGVAFIGRRNKEPLPEHDVPVFADLFGVAAHLDHLSAKQATA